MAPERRSILGSMSRRLASESNEFILKPDRIVQALILLARP